MNHSRQDLLQYCRDCLRQSLTALKDNRMRTVMSILGIAFGISAVMTVGIVSESGRAYVFEELKTYGLKSLWVYRQWEEKNPYRQVREGSGITNADYDALRKSDCCPAVARLSPEVYPRNWDVTLRVGNLFSVTAVDGVGVEFLPINNDDLGAGRNFRPKDMDDARRVALIGPTAKRRLFGDYQSAIGKTVRMGENKFTIVGELKAKNRDFLSAIGATQGFDVNDRLLIPYTVYQQILGTEDIHTLRAQARSQAEIDDALRQITSLLQRRHQFRYRYTTESMMGWVDTAETVMGSISLIGIVAASVALLVGGMGILSIMSTSVVERTREIGLRKALGARRRDILVQFLTEAVFISGIGGAVGLTLGGAATVILAYWSGFPFTPSAWLVAVAFVVSVGVGLGSGYYPAYRAARLRPVDALRYE